MTANRDRQPAVCPAVGPCRPCEGTEAGRKPLRSAPKPRSKGEGCKEPARQAQPGAARRDAPSICRRRHRRPEGRTRSSRCRRRDRARPPATRLFRAVAGATPLERVGRDTRLGRRRRASLQLSGAQQGSLEVLCELIELAKPASTPTKAKSASRAKSVAASALSQAKAGRVTTGEFTIALDSKTLRTLLVAQGQRQGPDGGSGRDDRREPQERPEHGLHGRGRPDRAATDPAGEEPSSKGGAKAGRSARGRGRSRPRPGRRPRTRAAARGGGAERRGDAERGRVRRTARGLPRYGERQAPEA